MKKYLPLAILIILGITTRLIPHLPNFTATIAIGLFGGLYLPKKWSYLGVVGTMLLSDAVIGFYHPGIMLSVYLTLIFSAFIGQLLQNKKYWILGGAILSSAIFFVATNAAVWAFGTMYTHDLSGLMLSYYNGLPFWRNMIMGDLFYTIILVGGYEAVLRIIQIKKQLPITQ